MSTGARYPRCQGGVRPRRGSPPPLADSAPRALAQVQFQAKGSSGGATVHADMFMDGAKVWQYTYLYVDVDAPYPQRLVLVNPQYAAAS